MNTLDELVRDLHTKMPMATQEDAIAFAHRLVAELAKGQEPVAEFKADENGYITPRVLDAWDGSTGPLYAAPVIPAGWEQLMRFYSVSTPEELVSAMDRHIERLQAKLPPTPDTQPKRIREG